MQKHRYKVSFFLTTLLYILLVLSYILYIKNQHFSVEQKPKEKVITLALNKFVPPVKEVIEPIPEPVVEEPELEPETEEPEPIIQEEPEVEEPEPIIQEEPVVEPEPIVVEKPIIKPKPVVEKPKKIKKKIKKIVKKRSVKKKKNIKRKKRSVRSVVKTNPAKKSQFLARLRAKINRAKSYPRIAQKRGMQGVVKVHFTILANGRVGNISINGPKVFHRSARSAVKSAFPISTKNASFSLPTRVNLTLRYQLR